MCCIIHLYLGFNRTEEQYMLILAVRRTYYAFVDDQLENNICSLCGLYFLKILTCFLQFLGVS